MMNYSTGLVHDSSELRKLIAENPDLPIVVLVGEEACGCDYYWTYCSNVRVCITELLDVSTPDDDEMVFTDRGSFEDCVGDSLYNDETKNLPDAEYDAMVAAEVAKYEPYWRKVIAIYGNN